MERRIKKAKKKESGTVSKEKERLVEKMNDVEASRDECKWSKAFRGGWMESGNQIKKRVRGVQPRGTVGGKTEGSAEKEEQKDVESGVKLLLERTDGGEPRDDR